MKKIASVFLFLVALLILAPFSAKADGGVFYHENFPVYESGQKAFIYYHNGVEDLIVQPSYQGSSKDFVWVMPTPSEPEVNKSSQTVFTALQKLTTPDATLQKTASVYDLSTTDSTSEEVQIIEEKTIDYFDIVTLKASNETALSEWMKTNKYSFPEDKNYLLADYINDGWYFVIFKIRPEAEADAQSDLNEGTITPIRFTFKSNKMIYPMKLTRVAMEQEASANQTEERTTTTADSAGRYDSNYSQGIYITLYTLSDNRAKNSQLDTSWANWIKSKDIKKILSESTEKDWIPSDKKLYLTKMSQRIYADQLKDDLILSDYKNNDIFPIPFYKQGYYWSSLLISFGISAVVLLLSPLFLLFVIFSLKEKYQEKWLKKAKWLKTALLAFFFLLAVCVTITSSVSNGSFMSLIEEGGYAGIAMAFIILETVLAVLTVKDFIRQKSLEQRTSL